MIALQAGGLPLLGESISSATYKKLNVIELGCGCGMVGIGLAQIVPDCSVILTDMPEAEEIATRNIANMNPAMSSQATFMPIDWELPLSNAVENRTFDVIIVSECTYNTDTIPALVRTLSALNRRSQKAAVLVSTKVRHSSESIFFELMEDAEFVKASHTKIPLPKDESSDEEPEVVHVYIFHNKNIPLKTIASENEGKPLVQLAF
jgi:predicted nicotinamide N-methyase